MCEEVWAFKLVESSQFRCALAEEDQHQDHRGQNGIQRHKQEEERRVEGESEVIGFGDGEEGKERQAKGDSHFLAFSELLRERSRGVNHLTYYFHSKVTSYFNHLSIPRLIMKRSSIFLKGWPKIHQPLPRTPRESQQLLNALTSSFRRQLDQAYPGSVSPREHHGDDQQPSNTDSSAHATDQHLQNILDNPLFRVVPPKASVPRENNALHRREKERRLMAEPMVVFDEMVASGTLTPAGISNCLKSQLLLLSRSRASSDVRKAMKESQAASRVVDWFWASAGESRKMLLQERLCISALTKFMVAQDLQGTVMTWLRMLVHQDLGGAHGRIKEEFAQLTFRRLLYDLVDAEMLYGCGLVSAMRYYLQACQIQVSFLDPQSFASWKRNVILVANRLVRAVMDGSPSAEKVPPVLYHEFSLMVASLAPRSLLESTVALYHPTHPDPKPLLRVVEVLPPNKLQTRSGLRRDIFLRIAIEAMRILMDQQKNRDAARLAQHVERLLPGKTNPQTTGESHNSTPLEEDYKSLLDRLGMSLA